MNVSIEKKHYTLFNAELGRFTRHSYKRSQPATRGARGKVKGIEHVFTCDEIGTERVYGFDAQSAHSESVS